MAFVAARSENFWTWRQRRGRVEVCFAGKGPALELEDALAKLVPAGVETAWLKQTHSADVVSAGAGFCGPGDGLTTTRAGLALAVVTADCVPVLLAGRRRIAAVHAGWRGLAASIIEVALGRFERGEEVAAWIGPAIGPCCYQVGEDVAGEVAAASVETVVRRRPAGRPHLDLQAAARHQLERGGVATIDALEVCTRCRPELLWSYRRDGPKAGRNLAFVWLRS